MHCGCLGLAFSVGALLSGLYSPVLQEDADLAKKNDCVVSRRSKGYHSKQVLARNCAGDSL